MRREERHNFHATFFSKPAFSRNLFTWFTLKFSHFRMRAMCSPTIAGASVLKSNAFVEALFLNRKRFDLRDWQMRDVEWESELAEWRNHVSFFDVEMTSLDDWWSFSSDEGNEHHPRNELHSFFFRATRVKNVKFLIYFFVPEKGQDCL